MKTGFARMVQGAGDLVFPPLCVGCREVPPEGGEYRHLCPACVQRLDFVRSPYCTTCGHPFYGEVEGERLCPHCDGLVPAYREGRTAVLLKGPARALIHELKYHRGLHVLEDMARILANSAHVLELVRGAVLVPVPLHPRKQRERGYNQSRLIAETLARVAGGGTTVQDLLVRAVDTVSQTRRDRKARQENLKNAFALAPRCNIKAGQHYVLVDDVFTTGSTLNACAHALRRAGAPNLDVVTLGHG